MVGFAIPIKTYGENVQAAIWAAGLKSQVSDVSCRSLRICWYVFLGRLINDY